MEQKVTANIKKYKIIIVFMVCSILVTFLGYLNLHTISEYYYDSGLYYQLGQTFDFNGNFSFKNYPLTYRGYLFPFILFIYTRIGDIFNLSHEVSILIGNSMFFSLLFVVILPKLFCSKNKEIKILSIIISAVMYLIFWQDLIYYPLSDLYSFGLIIIAIHFLNIISNNRVKLISIYLLSGVFLYSAYNIRTIYLFVIPLIILVYLILNRKDNIKKLALNLGFILLGMILISIPQSYINNQYYQTLSPKVYTESYSGNNLFSYQLYSGLSMQRYETFVGDSSEYPQPSMVFSDGVGNQLIVKEGLDANISIIQYIKLAFKYPLDFMGIIARHFINILHLPFNHLYINDILHYKTFYTILNYTILFLFGLGAYCYKFKAEKLKVDWQKVFYISLTIIPCIASLPGAIETRFFMPMYILIYCFSVYMLPLHEIIKFTKNNKLKVILSYIIILALLTAVWGSTFNSSQAIPQILK